jgi:hypothetical protein
MGDHWKNFWMCETATGQQEAQHSGDNYMMIMMMTSTDGGHNLEVGDSSIFTFIIKFKCTSEGS